MNLEIFLEIITLNTLFGSSAFFHGIIYVYDSNNPCTLEPLSDWMHWFYKCINNLLKKYKKEQVSLTPQINQLKKILDELPIILIANKCDKFLKKKQTKVGDLMTGHKKNDQFEERVKNQFNIISKAFNFKNNKNLLFLSTESTQKDLELFYGFIEQISSQKNSSLEFISGIIKLKLILRFFNIWKYSFYF